MNILSECVEYSPADRAQIQADRQLEKQGVPVAFSEQLVSFIDKESLVVHNQNRVDLRNLLCFTIDCDDTKDMDDAVNLCRNDEGYVLGVHIADVAAFVTTGSTLEAEAFRRGSSIYLPHRVVPMLPPILSDDLCSLNPGEDRMTLSVLMDLDNSGNVRTYKLEKSTIRSRLKASYSEVNCILSQRCLLPEAEKYAEVISTLVDMRELAEKLRDGRVKSGARISDNRAFKTVVNDGDIELVSYQRGDAETIIEEFMILANRLVAEYFAKQDLPVIYRIQEQKKTKARYISVKSHHAELALEYYLHFTSPIRRLADLKVHQVLSAYLNGMDWDLLHQTFDDDVTTTANQASRREVATEDIVRCCERYFIAAFFCVRQNENFTGQVVGYSRTKCPIIYLSQYHVRIRGELGQIAYEGQQVLFRISINEQELTIEAVSIKRLTRPTSHAECKPR